MRNEWKRGRKERKPGAEADMVTADLPALRIVPQPLWNEVKRRLDATKKTYLRDNAGRLWGRPGMGRESRYLLSGLARCWQCEANITMIGGAPGAGILYYGCSWHQNKGAGVCRNALRARMERADSTVLDVVKRTALTPAAIEAAIDLAVERIMERNRGQAGQPEKLNAEIRKLHRQRENLITAIASGTAPASLLQRIEQLDGAIKALEQQVADHSIAIPSDLDRARLKKDLRARVEQFEDLLRGDVTLARQALRKLLEGPIVFDASSGEYVLKGRIKVGGLFANRLYSECAEEGTSVQHARTRGKINDAFKSYLGRLAVPFEASLAA